jgi:PIN domain nuclease of toxin-antitoxin system
MSPVPLYLLDTHALYWHLFEPAKLSAHARPALLDGAAGNAVLIVYHLGLAELFYLLQKYHRETDFPTALALLQSNPHYRIEAIALEDIDKLSAYLSVAEMHDRLIVAATNRLGATFLTKDQNIQASPQVKWLW